MTIARKRLISLDDTPYYHCISRCVRRAFLCGVDDYSGQDYSHRRQWALDRLKFLCSVFAIDCCAYAIMSNHYHLVLKVDKEIANSWPESEVIERWGKLFCVPPIVARFRDNKEQSEAERDVAQSIVEQWRERLHNISWFMKLMNEFLARKANLEDNCKGRFWEARFKSQALLDERAVLSCMAYVDLNPIRAGMSDNLIDSDFTSIQVRIQTKQSRKPNPYWLKPFNSQDKLGNAIAYDLTDYIALVDHTGRAIRDDKRGHIDERSPQLLVDQGVTIHEWLEVMEAYKEHPVRVVGEIKRCQSLAIRTGQHWMKHLRLFQGLYRQPQ